MAQFGQDPVTTAPPAKSTPAERENAGRWVARTAKRLAHHPHADARTVLDVLGLLEPLRTERTPT